MESDDADDPWTQKRTVALLAIIDLVLAFILIGYSGARLLHYDYTDQTVVYVLYSSESVVLSMMYWLTIFSLLSIQVVIAFFLLTATNDMTTDPETMINKCNWWCVMSLIFFFALLLDLLFILYDNLLNGNPFKKVRACLDLCELLFRFYGICFIGKFIKDLKGVFRSPFVPYDHRDSSLNLPTPPLTTTKRTNPINNNYFDVENAV